MTLKIESLIFKLEISDRYSFVSPPMQSFILNEIEFNLDDGILTAVFKKPIDTLDEARKLVDPILRNWEVLANIELPKSKFSFDIIDVKTINLDPSPDPNVREAAGFVFTKSEFHGTGVAHSDLNEYPTPPIFFVTDAIVDTLNYRYNQFFEGKDKLQSMGYFCYTLLKTRFHWDTMLEKELRVSHTVIKMLARLTSENGDFTQARKVTKLTMTPLTNSESFWIMDCVKKLIIRLGEYNSGVRDFSELNMSNLPKLDNEH